RDVRDRLPGADLREIAVDDEGRSPQFGDSHGERELRAQGRLVEDHRDAARAAERLLSEPVGLQFAGAEEDVPLLARGEVVVFEEVPHVNYLPMRRGFPAAPR